MGGWCGINSFQLSLSLVKLLNEHIVLVHGSHPCPGLQAPGVSAAAAWPVAPQT